MNAPIPNEAAIQRIDELERELLALRTFFAPAQSSESSESVEPSVPAASSVERNHELLLCRAGETDIAIRLVDVSEVVPIARLLPIPGASECVLGTLDLHGTPVVVHDMGAHITGQCAALELTHLIVIARVSDGLIGIKVSEADDVIRARMSDVSTARAQDLRSDIVLGVCIHDGSQVMVLDVQAIRARSEPQQIRQ